MSVRLRDQRPASAAQLSGTYIYGMDRKGRVVMPSQFRQQLGAPFILTRAADGCLLALAEHQWGALVKKHEKSALFVGYYLSAAVQCRVDPTTGRFLIPLVLREWSELKPMDEVAICGLGRAILVCGRDRWDRMRERNEFPSLGSLDTDLEIPHPDCTRPLEIECSKPLGLAMIRCRGTFQDRDSTRVVSLVQSMLQECPTALILDYRQTVGGDTAVELALRMTQDRRLGLKIPFCLIADVGRDREPGAEWFATLDDVLWAMDTTEDASGALRLSSLNERTLRPVAL